MAQQKFTPKAAMLAADRALKSGDQAKAITLYTAVLARVPNHASAKKALRKLNSGGSGKGALSQAAVDQVVTLLQSSQFTEAAQACRALLLQAPKEPLLHNILGMCLANLAQPVEAARSYRKAVKYNPNYAEALGNLGTVLLELGLEDEALSTLTKALTLKPDLPEAQHSMGLAQAGLGNGQAALTAYDLALNARPNYVNAMNSKASLLKDMGQLAEAITLFKVALKLDPSSEILRINLGYAYSADAQDALAITILTEVLADNENLPEVQYRLGVQLGHQGQREAAITHLKKALSLAPSHFESYRALSDLTKFTADEPLIAQMEALIKRPDASGDCRLHLGFALGKAFEDCAVYPKAFEYFDIGNTAKRAQLTYTTEDQAKTFTKIVAGFTPALIAKRQRAVVGADKTMIFITGMMRSGTSLVEQILASHTDVFGAGELDDLTSFLHSNLDWLENLPPETLDDFARQYMAKINALAGDAAFVTDKLPVNFQAIGLIKTLFPSAKIIHLTRDPLDTCLSNFKNCFDSQAHAYVYDQHELGAFYGLYRQMMTQWHGQFPTQIYDLSYEALVGDQEGESRALLKHCGLDWQAGVLDFHQTERAVKTASQTQVRRKIYNASVQSWKHFEQELAPLRHALTAAGIKT